MKRVIASLLIVVATVAPHRAPAAPAAEVVATLWHYTPGDLDEPSVELSVERGALVVFTNAEVLLDSHSITAIDLGADGRPLFDSGLIPPGLSATVRGVGALEPGTYPFFCGLHLGAMQGRLTIV